LFWDASRHNLPDRDPVLSDRKKIFSGVEMVPTGAPKSSTIWSVEDDEMLLRMRAGGASFTDIAAKLGLARHQSNLAIPA
jgi:hypothetical protein